MDSPLRRALIALTNRQSLSEDQTAEVFGVVMGGEATPAQIGGLLMGLRAKGETADELAGATRALRAAMVRVDVSHPHLVDTCGTGGGTVGTFNISTVAAFVAAGAGAMVPKHGNRSYTSRCGAGRSTPSAFGWRSRTCVTCRAEIPPIMRRASSESWGMAPRRPILPAWRRCC